MSAILFLNRYFYPDHSATSQLLSDLAFDLARAGRDVHVITSRQIYDDPQAKLAARENVRGVKVHRVWTSRFGRGRLGGRALDYASFYVSATLCLALQLRRGDWVVAKTDPPLLSIPTAIVARLRGARFANWLQDLFPEIALALGVTGATWAAPLLRRLRNASLRTAQLNVVLGERMAQRLRAEGVAPHRIQVIHNWSDGEQIRPIASEHNSLRAAWGLSGRFVVGYSGNMGRAHEFETVMAAAQSVAANARIVFVFIGAGARRAWLERECRERRLDNVSFQPYQSRESLTHSLGVADVHVVSLYPALEGLIVPSKFYGIAAAGRPVLYIGDSDGEVPRLIRAADCGYAIEPGDTPSLVTILRHLASHPSEPKRLGANARCLFDQRFDRAIATRLWADALPLISGHNPVRVPRVDSTVG